MRKNLCSSKYEYWIKLKIMIKILEYSKKIESLLKREESAVEMYKIFIRINFSIDVYVVSKDENEFDKNYFKHALEIFLGKDEVDSIRVVFVVCSHNDIHDGIYGNIFKNSNTIDEGSRFRLKSMLAPRNKEKLNKTVPVVTFYSYKGGMGRTTTMISYAIDLALKKNKKVFIIDCDLEAPGYLNFFDLSQHEPLKNGRVNGLVEFLCDLQFYSNTEKISLQDYVVNLAYGNTKDTESALKNIFLMPAGNLNETMDDDNANNRRGYLEGLSRINMSDENLLRKHFQTLLDKVTEVFQPDIILIDSRTGFNDIIGSATVYLADLVVGFFGSNAQNTPGLQTLLDNYKQMNYKLILVNSILSDKTATALFGNFKKKVLGYIDDCYDDSDRKNKDIPQLFQLRRIAVLESLGTSNNDFTYLNFVKGGEFQSYNLLFDAINEHAIKEDDVQIIDNGKQSIDKNREINISNLDTWTIRNKILQNLKTTLASIKTFAEATEEIKESQFFYRNCMNELFEENKFIISGYKGTGKTFLYKALANKEGSNIATRIRERANTQRKAFGKPLINKDCKLQFLDVISIGAGNKSFEFNSIDYDNIKNPGLYFKRIWQIYTWNSILLEDMFQCIREESELKNFIQPIGGDSSVMRFDELMQKGISTFVHIENDMRKVNIYLEKKNIKLFLLYDQLDTKISPRYWDKAVSPLINHWRETWQLYSNILPKVFVRTDLYRRIVGTNTALLADNIISIEWSIEEIFSYLIKLVLSAQPENYWEIMGRVGRSKVGSKGKYFALVPNCKKEITKNDNQFSNLDQANMAPMVNTFLGPAVKVGDRDFGSPFMYFAQTLANADRESISLRPFINTLDKNAVEQALQMLIPNRYVQAIISSDIYASRDVRIKTANTYFNDLVQDEFSRDLDNIRTLLNSEKGKAFRYKTLSEKQFSQMIQLALKDYINTQCRTEDDMVVMLRANGIIEEKFVRGEKVWRFAPMYSYAWKLASTRYDKNDKKSYLYDNEDD